MMKKLVIAYKDFIFRLDCSENNTHIEESYRVKKRKDMKEFLKTVKMKYMTISICYVIIQKINR